MRTALVLGALCLAAAGVSAQEAAPNPAPAPKTATKTAAPKPATKNPNVVVLRSETKWWDDPVLNKPVSFSAKDADARVAVMDLARASGLPMTAVLPPPPAVVTPPAPAANVQRSATPAPTPSAQPAPPTKATLEFKNQPVRDVMRILADTYHLNWRKEGANYVLKDTNFVDTLRPNTPAPAATPQRPGYNNGYGNNGYRNRNGRRGGGEVAPGIYRQGRRGRR
jgi:hypothetical protein